ncbi:hypothetical protein S1OALGB6SA_561 [Olavius algarvensis spirochete endosymbiont]|nr:hypothetical protein S1OALGB6SA_561 [Olavius algarvensis spirochete endosymbiont]
MEVGTDEEGVEALQFFPVRRRPEDEAGFLIEIFARCI